MVKRRVFISQLLCSYGQVILVYIENFPTYYELYYRAWKVFVVNVYLLVGWLRVVFARQT